MSKRMWAAVAAALLFAPASARAQILDLFSNGTTSGTVASDSSGGTTVFSRTDQQPTGTGFIDPFVRLDATGNGTNSPELGYNTDFRPVQFDEKQDAQYTHSLLLADLGTVTMNGQTYYKFLLDANQTGSNPGISLDQLAIYQGNTALNTGYDPTTGTFSTGATLVYSLDTAGNTGNEVALAVQNTNGFNANTGSGSGDLYVYVLASKFDPANGAYVYLYSHFGDDTNFNGNDLSTNDGFEEWAANTGEHVTAVPEPSTMALALSGLVGAGFAGLRRLRRPRAATV
jgi:hypothetical protein